MYTENELLFPPYVIPQLRESRGEEWKNLVDRIVQADEGSPESLAFSLTMIRLDGCLSCETDSYRAMRGCNACAQQTLRRFKGTDGELKELFDQSLIDVEVYLEMQPSDPAPDRALNVQTA